MDSILAGLNEQQICAVTSPSNVLQVLAPPGSGKTKTLTARVAYHIAHEGLKPWNMIVCTFTIKAAREMKERIRSFVGDKLESKLVLGTFHSVARRYLSTYGHHIGIPKHFGIADSNDSLAMIKRIIKKNQYSMEPSKARSRISKRKSGVATARPVGAKLDIEQQEFEAIFVAYEQGLKEAKLLDYDDLLLRCVELLTKSPECVSNVEAVLIDEFQDTNHVQYELMNLFAQYRGRQEGDRIPRITIVGDPDQSIYSFRSAEIENLRRMRKRYADTQVVHLEENYRSSGAILQFAIEVIEQDTARPQKSLQATHSIGQSPVLRTLATAAMEAAWLISEIRRSYHLNAGLLTYSDYAILLRSSALSLSIETELGKAGIPYRMVGGHKFFDRVEIRILLDYLRVISQPDHNDALLRIINVPARKLGEKAVKALLELSEARRKSLWEVAKAVSQGWIKTPDTIKSEAAKELSAFVNIILTAHQKLALPQTTVPEMLSHVMQRTNYEKFLRSTYKDEYEDRAANVDELVQLAQSGKVFAEQEEELIKINGVDQQAGGDGGPWDLLAQFLANIALATDADKKDAEEKNRTSTGEVVISTIHAAKGLEWPVVFIPAAYQGSIPHSRAEDVDEERRLLYVGMTRAKALLYLSWPKKSSNHEHTTLSPFLSTSTMARYHETKGPLFGWSVSSELARILYRDCPSSDDIDERFLSVGTERAAEIRTEDNFYPQNGEEMDERYILLRDEYTAEELEGSYRGLAKKRKTNHISYGVQANVTSATGFTSAKEHLQELCVQAESYVRSQETIIATQATNTKPSKKTQGRMNAHAGQSSIKSFFLGRSTGTMSVQRSEIVRASRESAIKDTEYTKTQTPQMHRSTMPTENTVAPSKTMRKLPKPSFQRPRLQIEHEEQETSRYVLLSSSPVKSDHSHESTVGERVEKENLELEDGQTQDLLGGADTIQIGFVKSSTLHQTSMQKITGGQAQPHVRKIIGVRPTPRGYVNTQYRKPTFG